MKTFGNLLSFKTLSTAMLMGGLLLASCNKTNDVAGVDTQSVSNESAMDAQQDQVNDLASSALNQNDAFGGRVEDNDDRLACATVTKDPANTKDAGKITLEFNGNCKDDDGDVRTGKMIITWSGGRWYTPSSVHTITLEGYTINGVKIEGTRKVTNKSTLASPLTFTIEGSHNTTWPDGTTAKREVKRTRQWIRSSISPREDKWIISQTDPTVPAASGTTRGGKTYTVNITTPLQYFASCGRRVHIPVIGVKEVTVDAKSYTVDYGDGTCDNKVTITSNGASKVVTVDKDGN